MWWELRKKWNWLCLRIMERTCHYKPLNNSDLNELLIKATKAAQQKIEERDASTKATNQK